MTTGEKIKNARLQKGLTQQGLGDKLGISRQMIAQYEKGDRLPKLETLHRIANALEVPTYTLAKFSDFGLAEHLTQLNINNDLPRSTMEARDQLLGDTPRTREEARKQKKQILLEQYDLLNDDGQTAAVEAVENLTYNPKYTKEIDL